MLSNLYRIDGRRTQLWVRWKRRWAPKGKPSSICNGLSNSYASYPHGEVMLASSTRLDSDRALQHYRKAAALNPDSHEEQAYLGKMLAATGHLEEAIPPLRAAADHYPEDANLAYVRQVSPVEVKRT